MTIHGSRANINEIYSNDLKKASLAMIGYKSNKCAVEKDTLHCFKNQTIALLPKSIRRVLSILASKRSTYLLTATFEHDTGRSCLETKFTVQEKL